MIVETGHFALVLALALALVNSIVPLYGHAIRDSRLLSVAPSVALAGFAFTAYAFAALTYAHVVSDFSLVNVIENSASSKPLVYKISGVWGNHEGSMLLWVLILAIFAAAVAAASRGMPLDLRALVLCVQSWIAAAFLLFILLTSDPFARIARAPLEGQDLNPLLQDPGLAIHPPLLYLGYVGFSMTFSFAAAALIAGRIDAAWARFVRPWTLIAWIFLTLGIAMGSYWALLHAWAGGGFWFWDPVENASLMPWLAGTALLHSAAVMEKRDALKIWDDLSRHSRVFAVAVLGTFLVRSGVLTSVHAFASGSKTRRVHSRHSRIFSLAARWLLFAWRASCAKARRPVRAGVARGRAGAQQPVAHDELRDGFCLARSIRWRLNRMTGEKISVGAPFFNAGLRCRSSCCRCSFRHARGADVGVETPATCLVRRPTARDGLRRRDWLRRASRCFWRRSRGGPVFSLSSARVYRSPIVIIGSFVEVAWVG